MSESETCTLHYIGGAVTGLMGTQISLTTVQITWTPSSPALQNGYQTAIGFTPMPINFVGISAPPHSRPVSGTGVQTIVLRSLSRHYPIEDMSVTVTVLGERSLDWNTCVCMLQNTHCEMHIVSVCRCPSSNYHCISTGCHIIHCLLGSADVQSTSESVHIFPEPNE